MKTTSDVSRCPVCDFNLALPFFDGGEQPLATLAWPSSQSEAQLLPRHPLDFVQCPACTHVWNKSFRYDAIPYKNNPNRMFNSGGSWSGHLLHSRDLLLSKLPSAPVVVEIGCGEGHFLRGLAKERPNGRYVGFDPNASPETGQDVEFYPRLFDPLEDTRAFSPDAVVVRHVLEHLTEPAALLEPLAWAIATSGKPCRLFAEVPCIDRVFQSHRLADFFYEHASHFTTASFTTLMQRAGQIDTLSHGYDNEVVYAIVDLGIGTKHLQQAKSTTTIAERLRENQRAIARQLDELAAGGKRIAIWGGTGKAAAFIHHFGADADRFPFVVDSDSSKVGTYVPGTGQRIQFRDALKDNPVDIVIIPTQWRAKDIVAEMSREGIKVSRVLIEEQGKLIDIV